MLCLTAQAKVYDYTQGNRLTLLEDPASSVEHKLELIRNARHYIHIITFFWDDTTVPKRLAEEINKASKRGVEVRILTTYIATAGVDPFAKGKRELESGSDATFTYLQLTPGKDFSLTHSLHEKIFLVDGEKAIIGGRNISDSSLSGKDMEVEMQGPVVNQVQDHFKRMFDFLVDRKIDTACATGEVYEIEKCEKDFEKMRFSDSDKKYFPVQPTFENGSPARILSHEAVLHQFDNGMNRKERLLQEDDILDTVTQIDFKKMRAYNYFMIPTKRYRDFLEKNLEAGNSIEIISNSLESAKFSNNAGYIYALPDTKELVEGGIELYQWQRNQKLNYVHEKVLIFDEDHVIIGSHNFGTGSTAVSNEIAIEIKSKEIAGRLIDVFEGEANNEAITKRATSEQLDLEIEKHETLIKFYRTKILGSVIREIY